MFHVIGFLVGILCVFVYCAVVFQCVGVHLCAAVYWGLFFFLILVCVCDCVSDSA